MSASSPIPVFIACIYVMLQCIYFLGTILYVMLQFIYLLGTILKGLSIHGTNSSKTSQPKQHTKSIALSEVIIDSI